MQRSAAGHIAKRATADFRKWWDANLNGLNIRIISISRINDREKSCVPETMTPKTIRSRADSSLTLFWTRSWIRFWTSAKSLSCFASVATRFATKGSGEKLVTSRWEAESFMTGVKLQTIFVPGEYPHA